MRSVVRRGHLRHALYLEELTHQLVCEWLTERQRRWPASANPHLLVTGQTALDPGTPCISAEVRARPSGCWD
jgi:hypothetical protein